jgi:hypothetical protein
MQTEDDEMLVTLPHQLVVDLKAVSRDRGRAVEDEIVHAIARHVRAMQSDIMVESECG